MPLTPASQRMVVASCFFVPTIIREAIRLPQHLSNFCTLVTRLLFVQINRRAFDQFDRGHLTLRAVVADQTVADSAVSYILDQQADVIAVQNRAAVDVDSRTILECQRCG